MNIDVDIEHDTIEFRYTEVRGETAAENRSHGIVRVNFLYAFLMRDPRVHELFAQLDRTAGGAAAALTRVQELDQRVLVPDVVAFIVRELVHEVEWLVPWFATDLIGVWCLQREVFFGARLPEHVRYSVFSGADDRPRLRVLTSDPMPWKWWVNPLNEPRLPPGRMLREDKEAALRRAATWLYRTRVKRPRDSISAIARDAFADPRLERRRPEDRRHHVRRAIAEAERLLALAN